jgi:hypothetical protein
MEVQMRVKIAMALMRLAARVLEGPDDRVVLVNTRRQRSKTTGRVDAFVTIIDKHRTAAAFSAAKAPRSIGLPVHPVLATWAGYDIQFIA